MRQPCRRTRWNVASVINPKPFHSASYVSPYISCEFSLIFCQLRLCLSPLRLQLSRLPSSPSILRANLIHHVCRAGPRRARIQACVSTSHASLDTLCQVSTTGPFTHEVAQVLRLYNKNSDPVAFKVPPHDMSTPHSCANLYSLRSRLRPPNSPLHPTTYILLRLTVVQILCQTKLGSH